MNPEPSWRKPAGMFIILAIIIGWTALLVSQSGWIGAQHVAVQTVIYLVAGIVWILPLRPLLQWMETGSLKPPA